MLSRRKRYEDVRDDFSWSIPARYNIAADVCDRWADAEPGRLAILHVGSDGAKRNVSYGELREAANRLASSFVARGLKRGDRVGVLLPQSPETAIAHIATYKLGAIAVPLFTLFGPDALQFRLSNAGIAAVVTNAEGAAKLAALRDSLPDLRLVLCVDGAVHGAEDFHAAVASGDPAFVTADTAADDPAIIIYTSGTTGNPKGALHAHRVLLGHLPGVEMSHGFLPEPGDRIWTPADWAWIGGLLDVLLPALHHGIPVVSHRFAKFTGEAAFRLMRDTGVRNAFLPPTALKLMRTANAADPSLKVAMRSVASGGETLGPELLQWGRDTFGVDINEFYGQTECNMIVSSCSVLMPPQPGIMGRPVPGHDVAVIDEEGERVPPGETGSIAVRAGDPVMFLGYWNNPAATEGKFRNGWLLTGDKGITEADGWIRFLGRDDDVITSSGYRIGPGEIEDCLLRHPAVQMAGVVGKPDPERTEIVMAFIVLKPGQPAGKAVADDIAGFVKTQLAAHEYPREIEFVDELPMTTTGKIIRRELRQRAAASTAQR
ncbi:MAG: acyl-CoA synthetase [Rhizobiaceae bacterium]